MLQGRMMTPTTALRNPGDSTFDVASLSAVQVLDVPYPDFSATRLAADLAAGRRAPQWARLGPYDVDTPWVARLTTDLVRRCEKDGTASVAVIETGDPRQGADVLASIAAHATSAIAPPANALVVVLRDAGTPPGIRCLPAGPPRRTTGDIAWLDELGPSLLERLFVLTAAGGALLASVLQAAGDLRRGELAQLVEFAPDVEQLLGQLAARLLHGATADGREALGLAALVGYAHERYPSLAPALPLLTGRPWSTPLGDGWVQIDHTWRRALVRAAYPGRRGGFARLARAAGELGADGATDEAIELSLDAGRAGLACDLLTDVGLDLLLDQRPIAAARWLDRMPWEERRRLGAAGCHPGGPAAASSESSNTDRKRPFWRRRRQRDVDRGAVGTTDLVRLARGDLTTPRSFFSGLLVPDRVTSTPSVVVWRVDGTPAASPLTRVDPLPSLPAVDSIQLGPASPAATGDGGVTDDTATLDVHEHDGKHDDGERDSVAVDDATTTEPVEDTAVAARLLGDFEIVIEGVKVESWRGRQGRLLLAFLLMNSSRTIGRDALAEVFWPDAAPQASRNRLNVTMHALRLDLRAVTSQPVVLYRNGYVLNPDLRFEIDVDTFERDLAAARAASIEGDAATARAHYRSAIDRYRDDLLVEFPYEEWTILRREKLRVRMLDALSYVADEAFNAGCYAECIDAAQRLVAVDLCREDVHRLLMRAYARLDQPHRAMRQYRACLRQLGSELGVDAAPETVRLFDQIRARRPV